MIIWAVYRSFTLFNFAFMSHLLFISPNCPAGQFNPLFPMLFTKFNWIMARKCYLTYLDLKLGCAAGFSWIDIRTGFFLLFFFPRLFSSFSSTPPSSLSRTINRGEMGSRRLRPLTCAWVGRDSAPAPEYQHRR